MQHARKDYAVIQAPPELIPEDEPVFLLRAQDCVAAAAVRCWAFKAIEAGAAPEIVRSALLQADRMDAWRKKQVPDLPGPDN